MQRQGLLSAVFAVALAATGGCRRDEAPAIVVHTRDFAEISLRASVADAPEERAAALSRREPLAGEAIVLVHDAEAKRALALDESAGPVDVLFLSPTRMIVNLAPRLGHAAAGAEGLRVPWSSAVLLPPGLAEREKIAIGDKVVFRNLPIAPSGS